LSTWTRTEKTWTVIEYRIPSPAHYVDIESAYYAACEELSEATIYDDTITVEAEDGAVVVRFTHP